MARGHGVTHALFASSAPPLQLGAAGNYNTRSGVLVLVVRVQRPGDCLE